MSNNLEKSITLEHAGKKLFNYMKGELNISTRTSRKLLRSQNITVNGKIVKANYILCENDNLIINLEREESQNIEPEDIPISIAYEDDDLLVINKPPFMVVHPTKGHPYGTLSNAAMNYFKNTNQNCIVRLVNRLDRDTSGLVVIAKTQFAHQAMAKKMEINEVNKYYIAIVEGELKGKGTIDLPIDRPFPDSVKRAVVEDGYKAVTHYEVLSSSKEMSCVLIKLETGRTHQIRVHMSHIGHPVLGDTLYGRESELINRQALHAYKLNFTKIREDNDIEIIAKLPDDMVEIMKTMSDIINYNF